MGIAVEVNIIAHGPESGTEADTAAVGVGELTGCNLSIFAVFSAVKSSQLLDFINADAHNDITGKDLVCGICNGQFVIISAENILFKGTVVNDIDGGTHFKVKSGIRQLGFGKCEFTFHSH